MSSVNSSSVNNLSIVHGYFCQWCLAKRNGDWRLPCSNCGNGTTRVNVSICTTCGSTNDCKHSSPSDVPQAPSSNKRQKLSHTQNVPTRKWNRMTASDRLTLTKKGFEIRSCVVCQNGFPAKVGVPKAMCTICIVACASD